MAALGLLYTRMRLQAVAYEDGLSVERGFDRWRPALQSKARTPAVIGFCCAANILNGLPLNWLGIVGASKVNLPTFGGRPNLVAAE